MWPLFGSSIPNFQTLPDIMLAIHPMPMTSPLSSHESPHKNVIVNHSNHPTIMSLHDLRGFLSHRGHQKWMVVYGCLLFFLKKHGKSLKITYKWGFVHLVLPLQWYHWGQPPMAVSATTHRRSRWRGCPPPLRRPPDARRSKPLCSSTARPTSENSSASQRLICDMYIYTYVIYDDIYDIWWYDNLCV